MYYFVYYFICYALGIIICSYISYKIAMILSAIAFIITLAVSKKLAASFLIVLFTLLACLSTYYNSKSVLVQYVNNSVDITVKVLSCDFDNTGNSSRPGLHNKNNYENKKNIDSQADESRETDSSYNKFEVLVTMLNGKAVNEKSIIYINNRYKINENCVYTLNANVSEIQSNKNFKLYNYKKYLRTEKIYTSLFANNTPKLVEKNYSKANSIKIRCRLFVEDLFYQYMSQKNAGIILSIILGDKNYLEDELYSDIQRSGLAHIFAVSGLHIAILYSVFLKVFCFFGLNRKISWVITWSLLWIYGFLIGFPISVLRSLLMFTFVFLADLLYRKYNTVNSLAISALILLIYNPFYLFDAGFQLSFTAALTLVIYNKYIVNLFKTSNSIASTILLYITVQIFTYPILSYYFNYISIIGIIYNLLMVPVFSFITAFSFIGIFVALICKYTIVIPLYIVDWLMNIISFYIEKGAGLNASGIIVSSFSLLQCGYYYLALFLIVLASVNCRKIYKQVLFFIYIVFYLINFIILPRCFSGIELRIADVGQGIFCILKGSDSTIVFDAGSTSDKIGEFVCAPYMIKNSLRKIDSIFISHWHSDHYSGIGDIIERCRVDRFFSSSKNLENELSYIPSIIKTGTRLDYKEFKIDVLWPDEDYISDNENNMSNVLLLTYENTKILFVGDIEKEVEKIILDRLPKVDILIIPHHGSKSSSSEEFIKKVNPRISIMCYGRNNYGIPSKEVIDAYKHNNTVLLSTFIDGEINIMVIDNKIYYNTYEGNKSENYTDIYNLYLLYNIVSFVLLSMILIFSKDLISSKHNIHEYMDIDFYN